MDPLLMVSVSDFLKSKISRILLFLILFLLPTLANARDLTEWLDSCSLHRDEVESILKNEGVPIKYYYLMVAESRCNDKESHKGAVGFWQMMPRTGKAYGCDDLHDLECSTKAAAKYIKHLIEMLYNFDDVIMGYNQGGRNYIKRGETEEARGLLERVKAIMEADR